MGYEKGQKISIIAIIVNIIAIIVVIVSFEYPINLYFVIGLSLVFVLLGIYLLRPKDLLNCIQIRKNLGIRSIYSRGNGNPKELLERISKSRNVKIMAVSAHSLIKTFKEALIEALEKRNCYIQVLIAKGNSDFVKDLEKIEPERKGQITEEIRHTKSRLKEIIRSAKEPKGRIEFRTYNTEGRCSLIICDDSWAWYTPNLPPKRSISTFSLEIEKTNGGLLEDCKNHFNVVWKSSKPKRVKYV